MECGKTCFLLTWSKNDIWSSVSAMKWTTIISYELPVSADFPVLSICCTLDRSSRYHFWHKGIHLHRKRKYRESRQRTGANSIGFPTHLPLFAGTRNYVEIHLSGHYCRGNSRFRLRQIPSGGVLKEKWALITYDKFSCRSLITLISLWSYSESNRYTPCRPLFLLQASLRCLRANGMF